MEGHLGSTLLISANIRKAVQEGRADFTPVLLSEFTLLLKQAFPLDVALVHVSPPDNMAFAVWGSRPSYQFTRRIAKIIIAEVNQQMPRTLGDLHPLTRSTTLSRELSPARIAHGGDGPDEITEKIAQLYCRADP